MSPERQKREGGRAGDAGAWHWPLLRQEDKEQTEATSTAKLSHSGDHKYTHGLATHEAWPA